MKDRSKIIDHVISETLESFNDLKKLKKKETLTKMDYDYEVARDRKSKILLKSILAEINMENHIIKKQGVLKKIDK